MLKPHWRGRPIELSFESAFLDSAASPNGGTPPSPRTPQKTSLAIGGPFLRTFGPRPEGRRDLVVITLDTLRYDMLGAYGREDAHTPTLDRLAEEGLFVETAYSTANATSPAHTALFTSLYTKDHRVIDNHTTLHYDALTLAEILRIEGYETRACVSVRMLQQLSGLSQGFATFSGPPRGEQTGMETLDDVEAFLPEKAGAPLFLWVHFFDPHTPYLPPPEAAARIEGADGPPRLREAEIARYRAEISHTDDLVTRLLAILKDRGYHDPVLVIVADHGESLGEHGILFKHEGVHSVVTRVPLLFHGPGVPAGTRFEQGLASMVDVMPTAMDLVGVKSDQSLRGISLMPIVRGLREPR
ncbi:MAG: sulfatase, partial [Planctomycetota bacterium]